MAALYKSASKVAQSPEMVAVKETLCEYPAPVGAGGYGGAGGGGGGGLGGLGDGGGIGIGLGGGGGLGGGLAPQRPRPVMQVAVPSQ